MLMGTPEYMSPEQAEGGTVDHRTDLYALGVVLYQMLVGRVPFRGTTPHAVLHDVIYEAPPPPRQINPNLSPALEAAILKSVAKDPRQRFQRGADLVRALQQAIEGPPAGAAAVPPGRPPRPQGAPARRESRSPVIWILGAIALVLVVVVGLLLLLLGGGGDGEPTATDVALRPTDGDTTVPPTATEEAAVTAAPPTASATVATAVPPPTLVPVDTPTATFTAVAQATEASPPPTATELPATSTPVPTEPSAAKFGRLVFSSNRDGNPEIYVVDLAGGQPQRLTNNNANDWLPDWSPDGGRIAFTSHRTGSYDLWVMNADGGGQSAWVTTGAWDEYARWAPDGQRLSFSSTARTQGVDNSEIFVRQASGQLTQVTQSTAEDQWADWSPNGRLVYTEGFQDSSDWDIHLINPDGSNHTLWLDQSTCDVQPTWSPDGQWIAFLRIGSDTDGDGRVDFEDAGDVWVGRASGGGLRQLTSGMWATTPAWSPNSQWIAFARVRDSNSNGRSDENDRVDILAVPLNGGDTEPLVTGPYRDGNPSWTW
jgi:hypothetical protein